MLNKQIFIVSALVFSVGLLAKETEPEHFRITPEDEGMITKEFIATIRAGVGDEKASYASEELDDFVTSLISKAKNRMEYEDRKCDYLNYLQREDFSSEVKRKKDVSQTFTIDFTYRIYAPVRITNWLDYWVD